MNLFEAFENLICDVEDKNNGDYSGNIRLDNYKSVLEEYKWRCPKHEPPNLGDIVIVKLNGGNIVHAARLYDKHSKKYLWKNFYKSLSYDVSAYYDDDSIEAWRKNLELI